MKRIFTVCMSALLVIIFMSMNASSGEIAADDSAILFSRAVNLLISGNFEEGLSEIDKALELNPREPLAHALRSVALVNLGRFEEALESADTSVALPPESAFAHCSRGDALSKLERYDDAVIAYGRAIELDQESYDAYDAYYGRGRALIKLNRLNEALSDLDKAVELIKAGAPEARIARSIILMLLFRYDEAEADLAKAERDEPDCPLIASIRGQMYIKMWRLHEALEEFEKVISANQEDADAHGRKGSILSKLDRDFEALREMDEALRLDPDDPAIHNNRADLLVKMKRYDEAVKSAERAVELDGNYQAFKITLALALFRRGNDGDAERAREELTRSLNSISDAILMAEAYALMGEREKAFEKLREAIQEDPWIVNPARVTLEFEPYWEDPEFIEITNGS